MSLVNAMHAASSHLESDMLRRFRQKRLMHGEKPGTRAACLFWLWVCCAVRVELLTRRGGLRVIDGGRERRRGGRGLRLVRGCITDLKLYT